VANIKHRSGLPSVQERARLTDMQMCKKGERSYA
jgi:hypothetical protein